MTQKISKEKPLLLEAHDIITGERRKAYGSPVNGLTGVAAQWQLYLMLKYKIQFNLTAEDVCWMMADVKKIRQLYKSKRDNVVDAAGYIGLIEQVLK